MSGYWYNVLLLVSSCFLAVGLYVKFLAISEFPEFVKELSEETYIHAYADKKSSLANMLLRALWQLYM